MSRSVLPLTASLALGALACVRPSMPSHPPRDNPSWDGPAYAHALMVRNPPRPSDSALPTPMWTRTLRALYVSGCGEIVDEAIKWANANELGTESKDGPHRRYAFFDVPEPHGYFYVVADWGPRLHGTSPVTGYLVEVKLEFYSRERLSARKRQELQYTLDVPALERILDAGLDECGWFQISQ